MVEKLRILPSSSLARAAGTCPLLENQSDREAWAACCSRRFLPLARRIAGDNDLAMDILQESWIRVLEHVCAYRGGSPACAWVRTIVRNCALDIHRGHRSLVDELSADIADPSRDPEALAQQQQLTRLLREMVAALPAAYRDVCLMLVSGTAIQCLRLRGNCGRRIREQHRNECCVDEIGHFFSSSTALSPSEDED